MSMWAYAFFSFPCCFYIKCHFLTRTSMSESSSNCKREREIKRKKITTGFSTRHLRNLILLNNVMPWQTPELLNIAWYQYHNVIRHSWYTLGNRWERSDIHPRPRLGGPQQRWEILSFHIELSPVSMFLLESHFGFTR